MNRKSRAIVLLAIPALAVVIFFQNCSQSQDSGSGATSISFYVPTGAAGDAFNASTPLPYTPQGRLKADLATYPFLVGGYKAVAIAANGFGLATGSKAFASQAEADLLIQEQCQLLADNSPCAIFAEGDTLKYSISDFSSHLASVIASGPRTFDGMAVPTMLQSNRYYAFGSSNYTSGNDPFKAFAIGNYGRAAAGTGATQDEADQRALQTCEGLDGTPCNLYAQGDTVVFNVTVFSWQDFYPNLIYGPGGFSQANIPFLRATEKAAIQAMVTAAGGHHWALALDRYGDYYFATDATNSAATLENIALVNCNQLIAPGTDYTCMLHSVDGNVVWTVNDVKSHNSPDSTWN
jgi:hypothetical protein